MQKQKTIKSEVIFSGRSLQTGVDCSMVCNPAPENTGIVFQRVDLPEKPCFALAQALMSGDANQRRTTVGIGVAAVQTVEHFLAALWAMEIDNVIVEIGGEELPALDGSAKEFFSATKEAGAVKQRAERKCIKVAEPETLEHNGSSISIYPDDKLNVSYLIDYDIKSIGREEFKIDLNKNNFETEIAPARTFCLKREVEMLLKAGLGQGADLQNTLVMDEEGPVGTELRYANEPVRHKILDLIGDLYILGIPILGRVEAIKSGHMLNGLLVKKLYEKYVAIQK